MYSSEPAERATTVAKTPAQAFYSSTVDSWRVINQQRPDILLARYHRRNSNVFLRIFNPKAQRVASASPRVQHSASISVASDAQQQYGRHRQAPSPWAFHWDSPPATATFIFFLWGPLSVEICRRLVPHDASPSCTSTISMSPPPPSPSSAAEVEEDCTTGWIVDCSSPLDSVTAGGATHAVSACKPPRRVVRRAFDSRAQR